MFEKIINNPYLNLLAGLVLLITSGNEILETFEDLTLGSHHGVFVFAIIHILKTIPEIMHGLDELEKGKEELR
jgi:hypothetical protein